MQLPSKSFGNGWREGKLSRNDHRPTQLQGGFYMFRNSTNAASFFYMLIVAIIFSLSLVRLAAAQTNTSPGTGALQTNTTGDNNTAIGSGADVSAGNLTNATAIGAGAEVDASNKIRLGNEDVTVIEGQVAFSSISDKTLKENF